MFFDLIRLFIAKSISILFSDLLYSLVSFRSSLSIFSFLSCQWLCKQLNKKNVISLLLLFLLLILELCDDVERNLLIFFFLCLVFFSIKNNNDNRAEPNLSIRFSLLIECLFTSAFLLSLSLSFYLYVIFSFRLSRQGRKMSKKYKTRNIYFLYFVIFCLSLSLSFQFFLISCYFLFIVFVVLEAAAAEYVYQCLVLSIISIPLHLILTCCFFYFILKNFKNSIESLNFFLLIKFFFLLVFFPLFHFLLSFTPYLKI